MEHTSELYRVVVICGRTGRERTCKTGLTREVATAEAERLQDSPLSWGVQYVAESEQQAAQYETTLANTGMPHALPSRVRRA